MAKLEAAKQYISTLIEGQAKMIVFTHHKITMDALQAHLEAIKCKHIRLDGSTLPETRAKKVSEFQDESEIRVALLSITALGVGFTLTAASTVIFA